MKEGWTQYVIEPCLPLIKINSFFIRVKLKSWGVKGKIITLYSIKRNICYKTHK